MTTAIVYLFVASEVIFNGGGLGHAVCGRNMNLMHVIVGVTEPKHSL